MGFFDDILGISGARAAEEAAQQQAAGLQQGIQTQQQAQETVNRLLGPSVEAGGAARNRLLGLLGLPGGDDVRFEGTPGFEFQLQQGLRGVSSALGAAGLRGSGRTLKAAQRFGTGLAAQDRGNEINRLLGLTNLGQQATGQQVGATQGFASNIANLQAGVGQAQAGGTLGAQQARTAGINNLLAFGGRGAAAAFSPISSTSLVGHVFDL